MQEVRTYVVCAGDDQSNNEHSTNVEDDDTPEGPPNRLRDVLRRVLRLTDGHTNKLGTDEGEQSIDEGAPETQERGELLVVDLGLDIRTHGPMWGFPVAETDAVVLRVTSEVDDDAHENETDECDDLDAAEPEFELAEDADAE